MYPDGLLKGLMRERNEGAAVERSASVERRDQPMLLRELRKADSLEADMLHTQQTADDVEMQIPQDPPHEIKRRDAPPSHGNSDLSYSTV